MMNSRGVGSRNGVVIICNRRMAKAMLSFNPEGDEIITVRLQGKALIFYLCRFMCLNQMQQKNQ